MIDQLFKYAQGSPFLLLTLVVLGAILYTAERVFALSGPITKLVQWWQGRALAKLRREAEFRAEQRRIQMEEESAVLTVLRGELADLSAEVSRLRGLIRASEAHHRQVKDWADGLLRSARAAGLTYVDPPSTGEQEAVTA